MNEFVINTNTYKTEDLNPDTRTYDLAIIYNSSESRALSYRMLLKEKSVDTALLVNFDGKGNAGKIANLDINKVQLEKLANRVEMIELNSIFDYQANLDTIAAHILHHRSRRCLNNIFLDVTGAPLIYSAALMKFVFRLFPVPKIALLNVSGRYAERGEQQFSEGEQYEMYIPGYYGNPDHSKQLHYIFLLGYDGDRSLNIYRENLPEKISVIIPSPGYDEGNDVNTINNNKEFLTQAGFLFKEHTLPRNYSRNKQLYNIDISDIVAVMNRVETIYQEDKDDYEIRLVPLGPKSHAIGAALAAIYNDDISIMYQVPRKYFMSEIPMGDKMWLYDIDVPNVN